MVSHSRVKRFLWLLALIALLFSLLPASPGPPSAAPNTPVPNVQTYSLVEINGQLLDASTSPPAPAVLSHTPKPFLPWFRELDTEKFPGPEYVNVSAEPATYLTDQVLWSFRAVPCMAPGLTVIHFTWTSQLGGVVGVATFVVINTGPSPEEGSHEIRHLFNGIPLWTISGPGWQTTLRTFEGISFRGDQTHLGTWSLTQDVNGAATTTPFFVRAMGVENFGITPSPFDPSQGTGMITADIVGLPPSPDPASWIPDLSTTWTLTIQDPVTQAVLFTFEGGGTRVAKVFDGMATPEMVASLPPHIGSHIVANQPLPGGDYPMTIEALDPVARTDLVAQATLNITSGVAVTIEASRDSVRPLKTGEPNSALLTVTTKDGRDQPKEQRLQFVISVPPLSPETLKDRGGHAERHSARPLGVFRIPDPKDPKKALRTHTAVEDAKEKDTFRFEDRTDENGQLLMKYVAPVAGGVVTIKAFPMGGMLLKGSRNVVRMDVQVPDLHVIGPVTTTIDVFTQIIRLNGTGKVLLARHPDSHYLSSGANLDLELAALAFFDKTGERLIVNDASLAKGGVFDLAGNWAPDHKSHRAGIDVDIENARTDDLDNALTNKNWEFISEGAGAFPHYRWKPKKVLASLPEKGRVSSRQDVMRCGCE